MKKMRVCCYTTLDKKNIEGSIGKGKNGKKTGLIGKWCSIIRTNVHPKYKYRADDFCYSQANQKNTS
jgi:hypothetical protein